MKTNTKKILLVCALLMSAILLAGCAKVTDEHGNEHSIEYGLIEIGRIVGNGYTCIMYDPTTKICYMYISSLYARALSPYYVIGEDGKPEIAVYRVNYMVNK